MTRSSFFCLKLMTTLFFLGLMHCTAIGQSWMAGYQFRKKITIDKSKVTGPSNLLNFNVLIELEDEALKYMSECGPVLQSISSLPISFATKTHSDVPIGFQVDSYEPEKGKLSCWVQVAELIAAGSPGLNELYFYYGGYGIHDPFSVAARAIWPAAYQQVWHMNADNGGVLSRSANHSSGNNVVGSPGMIMANFSAGRIGQGVLFDGVGHGMMVAADTNTMTSISTWVNVGRLGTEQMILANDSAGSGYRIKINAAGHLVFDVLNDGLTSRHTSIAALTLNTWNYLMLVFSNRQKKIYINGLYSGGGAGGAAAKMGRGAAISIGISKQNDSHFKGAIDELRILNVEKSLDWMLTEYRNQRAPASFISSSMPETNPLQIVVAKEFTNANGSGNWAEQGNWSDGVLPGRYSNVIIGTGQSVQIMAGNPVSINRLRLESNASLTLNSDLELNCTAQIAAAASIVLHDDARLVVKKDMVNDGSIVSGQQQGELVFRGDEALQTFSGSGIVTVSGVLVDMVTPDRQVILQSPISVTKQLLLKRGTLNANGRLTLLAMGPTSYGSLMPVDDIFNAGIIGEVKVQHYVDGDFLSPSTARGWWLLSSPVFQIPGSPRAFNLNAVQESIFVTGPAPLQNGFDPSPNNKSSIYTHNQALAGTLSQKYTGIPNMAVRIPCGRGFYAFSRGSRYVTGAYQQQLQGPVFSNPQPYKITYSGNLFTGMLKMDLSNLNSGAEGDGYHLLGNPYASGISWGALGKVNLQPFVWVFDPRNNAYLVTDDPEYVIHSGKGFFVRVASGHVMGELTFTESAKYVIPTIAQNRLASSQLKLAGNKEETRLKISISRSGLSDDYTLRLHSKGNDAIDDADAAKIGEGYLSIAGLTADGIKLAIDTRAIDTTIRSIPLFVKGWANGTYTLSLKSMGNSKTELKLKDHYLNLQRVVANDALEYPFYIDIENKQTFGSARFSLIIEQAKATTPLKKEKNENIFIYPNPVNERLFLKSTQQTLRNLQVVVRTIAGQIVWRTELPLLEPGMQTGLPCHQLHSGVYVLQLFDPQKNKTIVSFKVIKN
uniref:LamG-like jellyroll fold domain-containing protein n=1 Tax=Pedobacter schmidteae TaxID=2201271 RepID=UPI000EB1C519|nr:LamG-like jellyroll fold domain-containing protein [Pedobacter schmidteae]